MEEIVTDKRLKHNEENRKYYARHREARLAKMKEYQLANKEYIKDRERAYCQRNAERRRANTKAYQAAHPEARRELYRERRARLKAVEGGHFTDREWKELVNRTGNKCLCCGATDIPLVRDHVVPLGPPHSDEIKNIQPLCRACNSRKGTTTTDYRSLP